MDGGSGLSPGAARVKEEPVGAMYHVVVKEEPAPIHVKEEPKCESGAACVSETDARMYADHVIKDELMLGPEHIQQLNERNSLCGDSTPSVSDHEIRFKPAGTTSFAHDALPPQESKIDNLQHTANTYMCVTCGQIFSTKLYLIRHFKTHFENSAPREVKKYSCKICNKEFRKNYLKTHERLHTGDKPYACEICKKGFALLSSLRVHKLTHTEDRPYTCDICKKSFARSSYLKLHKQSHTGVKPYSCGICRKRFTQLPNLKSHIRIHTGEKPYGCPMCKKRFAQGSALEVHKRSHTGERPYSCEVCKKKFMHFGAFKTHKVIHTEEKAVADLYGGHVIKDELVLGPELVQRPSIVNALNGVSRREILISSPEHKTVNSLVEHAKTHLRDKSEPTDTTEKVSCKICNKKFRKSYIKVHERFHTGEKPYACDLCKKEFTVRCSLKKHKLIHTEEKPYLCDICKKSFARLSSLRKHKRSHAEERPYRCEVCKMGFTKSFALKSHLRTHTGERPYCCTICNKRFKQWSGLNYHKITHTGKRPYSCEICKKTFVEHKHECEASVIEKLKFENSADQSRVNEMGAYTGEYAVSVKEKPKCENSVDLYRVSETGAQHGQDAVSVKVNSECESSAECGVSEKDAVGQYVNNVIGDELLLGPEEIQQPNTVDTLHTSSAPLNCEAQTHTPQISVATTNNKLTAARSVPSNTEHESTPPQKTDTNTLQATMKNIKENHSTTDKQITTNKRRYSCDICKKAFTQSGSLSTHKRIHTGDKPYACEVCNKKFTALGTLNNHKAVHMKIRAYSCKLCKKEFKLLSALKGHERSHSGVKPFPCEICNKKFTQKLSLKNHEKIHTGVKPYSCEICKKQFTQKGALHVHNKIHTGEKPYSCEICKRQFRQKAALRGHKQTHVADRSKILKNT